MFQTFNNMIALICYEILSNTLNIQEIVLSTQHNT